MAPTIHATAVLAGTRAVLIRGPAGAGKSRLGYALLSCVIRGELPFARLVGDDRVHLEAVDHRLLVRPAPTLAGLMEIRGLGVLHLPFEPVALAGMVVDLADTHAERLPPAEAQTVRIEGVLLPRLAVAPGINPLPLVLSKLGNVRWIAPSALEQPDFLAAVGKK